MGGLEMGLELSQLLVRVGQILFPIFFKSNIEHTWKDYKNQLVKQIAFWFKKTF